MDYYVEFLGIKETCKVLLFQENLALIAIIGTALPCIGVTLTAFFIPESPSWLISKNRLEEAKASMGRILGADINVETEISSLLKNSKKKEKKVDKTFSQQFASKFKYLLHIYNLRPFMLVLVFFFFQQFSGVFVILFYALDIVENAGITFDPHVTIVVIALVRIVAAIMASIASKKYGRRPLSMISGSAMSICLLGLVGFLYITEHNSTSIAGINLIPYFLLMLYFFTSCIGFLPLPFALSAELFPTKIKGLASGLSSGVGYFFNFVTVKIYPTMVDQIGSKGVFAVYGLTSLVGTIYLAWFLPETKGKSVEEIQAYFGKTDSDDIGKSKEQEQKLDVVEV